MSDTITQIRVLLDRAAQLRDNWRQHQARGLSASLVSKIDVKRQLLETFVEIAELTARYSRERSSQQPYAPPLPKM